MTHSSPLSVKEFATTRLFACSWNSMIEDARERRTLEYALARVLTPKVLEHLPKTMQLSPAPSAVSEWISARSKESEVLVICQKEGRKIVGLLMLTQSAEEADIPTIHLGYVLAQEAWGKGYATELVSGLVKAYEHQPPKLLVGGVGIGNTASAKVLEKSGFRRSKSRSTPDTDIFVRAVP